MKDEFKKVRPDRLGDLAYWLGGWKDQRGLDGRLVDAKNANGGDAGSFTKQNKVRDRTCVKSLDRLGPPECQENLDRMSRRPELYVCCPTDIMKVDVREVASGDLV